MLLWSCTVVAYSLLGHILLLVDPWLWMRWNFCFSEKSFLKLLSQYSGPHRLSKAMLSNRLPSDHANVGWPLPKRQPAEGTVPLVTLPSDGLIPIFSPALPAAEAGRQHEHQPPCYSFISSVYSNLFASCLWLSQIAVLGNSVVWVRDQLVSDMST